MEGPLGGGASDRRSGARGPAGQLLRELIAAFRAVEPYVSYSDESSPGRRYEGGPVADPRSDPSSQTRLFWYGVSSEGLRVVEQMRDLLAAAPGARDRWGATSREGMLSAAIGALAFGINGPERAATVLAHRILASPPSHVALLPVSGLRVAAPLLLGGVRFAPGTPDALAEILDPLPDLDVGEFLREAGAVVWLRMDADAEVALTVLRERFRALLPLLLLARDEEETDWYREMTISIGSASAHAVAGASKQLAPFVLHPTVRGWELTVGEEDDARIQSSSGLRRVADLAAALPARPLGGVDGRLLRAAVLLGESFDGALPDRLLRRWMAVEALLGDSGSELGDRLCERMAVVSHPDAGARLERKRALRELYRDRNDIAHGRTPRAVPDSELTWFRMLAHVALRAIADLDVRSERELFELIDRVKFEGLDLERSQGVREER